VANTPFPRVGISERGVDIRKERMRVNMVNVFIYEIGRIKPSEIILMGGGRRTMKEALNLR
jgi:hypothetical protein